MFNFIQFLQSDLIRLKSGHWWTLQKKTNSDEQTSVFTSGVHHRSQRIHDASHTLLQQQHPQTDGDGPTSVLVFGDGVLAIGLDLLLPDIPLTDHEFTVNTPYITDSQSSTDLSKYFFFKFVCAFRSGVLLQGFGCNIVGFLYTFDSTLRNYGLSFMPRGVCCCTMTFQVTYAAVNCVSRKLKVAWKSFCNQDNFFILLCLLDQQTIFNM